MSHAHGRWFRLLTPLAVLLLVAAACGKSSTTASSPKSGSGESPMPSTSEGGMMMQPGADKMHVSITSPKPGFTLTGNTLALHVKVSGFTDTCDFAGKDDMEGIGHYHVLLDGSLVNMFCTSTARVSMQNVSAGEHMIEVVPAQDNHTEIMDNAEEMPFTYDPKSPLPEISQPGATGQPAIRILRPADGATLNGPFAVKVAFTNFTPACSLMGKPDLPGYGHWHVNVDSMSGPMMGMGTMLGMSCTATFTGTTQGLQAGSTHTLFALLTDNGHAPIDVFDKVDFTVGS